MRGLPSLLPLVCGLSLAGCVAEWNDAAPGLPLLGEVPSLDRMEHLNAWPAGGASLIEGADGAPWTSFCEFSSSGRIGGRLCTRQHLRRLDGAPGDEVLMGDDFTVRYREIYIGKNDPSAMTRTLTLHRPGARASDDVRFPVPFGPSLLYVNFGGDDDVFVYWVLDKATTGYDIYRRDQRHHRRIPVPAGVDPTKPARSDGFDFLFSSDGNTLVVREPSGRMIAYSTRDDTAVQLGARSSSYFIDDPRKAVVTLDDQGLVSVPLDGSQSHVLVQGAIDGSGATIRGDALYYRSGSDLYSVALDGKSPPSRVQAGAARLLELGPNGEVAFSRDLQTTFSGGSGDGWVGAWRFMERGRNLAFSGDGTRLRFLEHAATIGTVGDLTSVRLPAAGGGAPLVLGINVHAFDEAADGRVLSVENHVYEGTWNRLVVVDEQALTRRWLVPQASFFFLTPDRQSVIVDVVTGASGYDIVKVPVPPR